MYTFLFTAGADQHQIKTSLRRAGHATVNLLPGATGPLAFRTMMFPEVHAGWCIVAPENPQTVPYVSDYVDEAFAVLAFGVSMDGSKTSMATILASAWRTGGITHVQRLDNSFAAILLDRVEKAIYILSDQVGLKSLHYHLQQDQIWVSPHDVPIVAGSSCRLELNPLSVYSVLRTGWSLRGMPLLHGFSITDPRACYTWKDRTLTVTRNHLFERIERIQPANTRAKKTLVDEMIEYMNASIQKIIAGEESIITDLTAGWDTRTVAALLLHNASGQKIYTLTHGGNSSLECRTAKWFAHQYHLEHLQSIPGVSSTERVEQQIAAHAFFTNGQGSCFRVFSTGSIKTNSDIPHFTGHNAGYHKGLYYPNKFVTDPSESERIVAEDVLIPGVFVGKAFHYVGTLEHELQQVLRGIINEFREISSNTHDILDLFTVYERFGRFSVIDTSIKFPTVTNRYCVFESPALIRLASRMPSPIGQNTILLREILKRYATRSYYRLMNDRIFAPALFNKHMARLMKMTLEARARGLAFLKIPKPSPDEIQAQAEIRQLMHRYTLEICESVERLIPPSDHQRPLQETIAPPPVDIKRKYFYCHLITLSGWYRQIQEARRIALLDASVE